MWLSNKWEILENEDTENGGPCQYGFWYLRTLGSLSVVGLVQQRSKRADFYFYNGSFWLLGCE
jgi:hypothetical protein